MRALGDYGQLTWSHWLGWGLRVVFLHVDVGPWRLREPGEESVLGCISEVLHRGNGLTRSCILVGTTMEIIMKCCYGLDIVLANLMLSRQDSKGEGERRERP